MKSHLITLLIGLLSVCPTLSVQDNLSTLFPNDDCLECLFHTASLPQFSSDCSLQQISNWTECLCGRLRRAVYGNHGNRTAVPSRPHRCSDMINQAKLDGGCPFTLLIENAKTLCSFPDMNTTTTATTTTSATTTTTLTESTAITTLEPATCNVTGNPSVSEWPFGKFAIPRTTNFFSCPTAFHTGYVSQATESGSGTTASLNAKSDPNSVSVDISASSIRVDYCVKTFETGPNCWPRGSYCINRFDGVCPEGFTSGRIHWDNEDTAAVHASAVGTIPDLGTPRTGPNTLMEYCCRNDGPSVDAIQLPTIFSFYLYPLHEEEVCQSVQGTFVRLDYILWDTEDTDNTDFTQGLHPWVDLTGTTIKLFMCFYEII